jgi:hypothetical protein
MAEYLADNYVEIAKRISEIKRMEHRLNTNCRICAGEGEYFVMGFPIKCPLCRPIGGETGAS